MEPRDTAIGQDRRPQQFYSGNQPKQSYGCQQPPYSGNNHKNGCSNYNSSSSLSALSRFVTDDGVTFDVRRNQGFLNSCTVK